MDFGKDKPKPSDRSIFRMNVGRALLNKNNDSYLKIWNIDFLPRNNRVKFRNQRNIEKEKLMEKEITEILKSRFCFRPIIVENEDERIGSKGIESKLIGTVSKCSECKPSENWLGCYSPIEQIKTSGLWLVQHLNANEITDCEMKIIAKLVYKTKNWVK